MLRLILLLAAVAIVVSLIKRRLSQALRKPPQQPSSPKSEAAETVVRCDHCGTHIPASEAITHQGQHFCCPAHQRDHQKH
jgi:uncharacterized protein